MLKINNLYTIAEDDHNKKILNGLNLNIGKGEIHVIMGPNGSGKSTLANTIFASSKYIVTEGSIIFEDEDITGLDTNKIAKKGIFMSFQKPEAIPGISLGEELKTAKNSITGEKQDIFKFRKEVEDIMSKLDIDKNYIKREFNVGFSGGEQKKSEILQLLVLNPKLAILDETDSGLDVDAIKAVIKGINLFKNDENSIIIITHSIKMLEGLNVDKVHVLVNGRIVKEGDISLAYEIDKKGYKDFIDEN